MFSKEKITIAYTIEKCEGCGIQKKRKFAEGDVLFSKISKCNSCDGDTVIDKIFGETIEQ
ncbi:MULTISPECIES: hypothetical protein [Nitrosopumilus]|uniref:Uncharacterized protein n=1 Tax=Nitrosopumilus piranensis TaxID=1582439 RepID=A0A0C5CCF3_9ARCH|nr:MULTISPECIES: hypothetical protein [Nitrosopumilus]AJM92867.1 hypothetical protein NPIRD3C_1655 [Nitrosopumilus piranensis]KAF6244672.1 hypothetical protein C6989_07325 [Nitrosopumilus sp. b2]